MRQVGASRPPQEDYLTEINSQWISFGLISFFSAASVPSSVKSAMCLLVVGRSLSEISRKKLTSFLTRLFKTCLSSSAIVKQPKLSACLSLLNQLSSRKTNEGLPHVKKQDKILIYIFKTRKSGWPRKPRTVSSSPCPSLWPTWIENIFVGWRKLCTNAPQIAAPMKTLPWKR